MSYTTDTNSKNPYKRRVGIEVHDCHSNPSAQEKLSELTVTTDISPENPDLPSSGCP